MSSNRVTVMESRPYKIMVVLPMLGAAVCLWSTPAHAYIDGGTASMIFQMLIAGGLAAMVTFRVFWARIKLFLGSIFWKKSSVDE